jgi:hypothetical protein
MKATVYVLTENISHEGGSVSGVFSTFSKAKTTAMERPHKDPSFEFWAITEVAVDRLPLPPFTEWRWMEGR